MALQRSPVEIGEAIADAGALIGDERIGVLRATAAAIKNERRGAVYLTRPEARAALEAISQMTSGNARSFVEWRSQTSGTLADWRALLRAEAKIQARAK
jgi:hypothetical protein